MIGNAMNDTQMNECNGTYLQLDNTVQEVDLKIVYDNGVTQGIELAMALMVRGFISGAACVDCTRLRSILHNSCR